MPGWTPASALTGGAGLPALFATAHRRWGAAPHAAATLSWKSYSYWVAMPAVLSWAVARRVPLVSADNVLVRFSGEPGEALVQVGLRGVQLAVLPDDPLAHAPHPGVTVVGDESLLLKTLRTSLLDHHLDPVSERIREHVKVGRRTLLGSVASGIAYALVRGGPDVPGSTTEAAGTVLSALGLDDLVDLVPSPTGEPAVQRRTCCLAFTLPQPKVCGGCCLR
ncbi:IucA/IucC family C-terminal-domain containing protein [Catellatospora sp. KI3]|uniref:IucA/IucC family C-terminal-domain containing protein n=1 Tax=Catellatospora sp. KI3 TaxID=3041620 RepID=UPI0024828642|nr:IucA/IucC family C-terminal-domain containing protein [Catellatospora sp. KI3]MDI1464261.1 IucA/IucC family C-terminal-domain containing protein [Catellatospora sp. KI3]